MDAAIRSVLESPEIPYGEYRRVAVDALAPFGVEALPVIEQKIAALTPAAKKEDGDWDTRKRAQVGIEALRHAAVHISAAAKRPLSEADRTTLAEELISIGKDLEALRATLVLLDDQTLATFFSGDFQPKDYRPLLKLAYLAPSTLPRVIAATAQMELGKYDGEYLTAHIAAIDAFGPAAVPSVLAALPTAKNDGAEALVRGIEKAVTAEHAPALVELLGHGAKPVRLAAMAALQRLGAAAKAALEKGAQSKKKAIREACTELASTLGAERTRADELLAQAAPEREALVARFKEGMTSDYAKRTQIHKELAARGALALAAAHDWLREGVENYEVRGVWNSTLDLLKKDPDAAWVAIKTFASLPKLSPYSYRDFTVRFKEMGKLVEAPLVTVLKGPAFPLRVPAFELLTEVSEKVDRDLLVAGLADASKEIRTRCIELLPVQHGREVAPLVMPLLADKSADTRLAAAQVLATLGSPEAHPAIAAALEKQKKPEIAAALEKALAACAGSEKPAAAATKHEASSDTEASVVAALAKERMAKLPTWVDLATLPKLRLASGQALEGDALAGFVTRLMNEGPDLEDPVVRRVRPFLEDATAAAFAVAIKDAWARSKGEAKHKWAIYQQAILADDARLNAVAPRLDELTSGGQHHLAGWYVDVLARHGTASPRATSTGLSWIAYWAKAADTTSLRKKAVAAIESAAQARGMTVAQLEGSLNGDIADDVADTQIPTLGFEAAVTLDYGPRQFTLRVSPELELVVTNEQGETLDKAPTPGKKDDAEKAKAAKDEYGRLKKMLAALAREQRDRLENAMVSGRAWSKDAFEKLFVAHSLMRHFGERLVFASGKLTFRLFEGKPHNAADEPVTLGEEPIRLVHRYELDDVAARAWGENLADSKIIQPFDQIGRVVHARVSAVAVPQRKIPPATLSGRLRGRGWRHTSVEDAGMCYQASRAFPGRRVRAHLSHGGVHVSDPAWSSDPVGIERLWFTDLSGETIKPEAVDPIVFSEVVRDLDVLLDG